MTRQLIKRKYLNLEDEINSAINDWDYKQMKEFFSDILPLVELFDVEEEDDWLKNIVGGDDENVRTIRLIKAMYLIARIAHIHTPKLISFRCKYPNLHERMKKVVNSE